MRSMVLKVWKIPVFQPTIPCLGVRLSMATNGATLPKWGADTSEEGSQGDAVRYPVSSSLNNKLVLWDGDICGLQVIDACI
jgi:hypothetical protein